MTGVEILDVEQIATEYAFNWSAWLLTIGVVIAFSTIISFATGTGRYCRWWELLLLGVIVGLVFGGIIGLLPGFTTKPVEFKDQYKVLISEDVLMVEFMERYEIIDQEGKIYTVREIND